MSRTPYQFHVIVDTRPGADAEQVRKALQTLVDSALAYAGEADERGLGEMDASTTRLALEANFHAPQLLDVTYETESSRTPLTFMIQVDVPEGMAHGSEACRALNSLINCGLINADLRSGAFSEAPEALAELALDIDLYSPRLVEPEPAIYDPQPGF
ncbi:hypothetical protein [Geopseudomonas aromaticivorans]